MLKQNWEPNAAAEKKQLLTLFLGASIIAPCLWFFAGARIVPVLLAIVATSALVGVLFHRHVGRDIFLAFAILSAAIGGVVSKIVMILFYIFGIGVFGSIMQLFGMNRLRKRFQACKQYDTMFVDAPDTNLESFRRQS